MPSELTTAIYGLLSAFAYGSGDFIGGLNSKRIGVLPVIFLSQVTGLILYVVCAFFAREAMPPDEDLIFAAAAGIVGMFGISAMYLALSLGYMGISAPIAGVLSAAIPVIVGISTQGLPELLTLIGFAVGLLAVWLVAGPAVSAGVDRRAVTLAVFGGTAFGLGFVLFARAAENATFIPLIASRSTTISFILVFSLLRRRRITPTNLHIIPLIALGGMLDALGNAFFVGAVQAGRLDIASVISSLYPAVTVLLAWVVLKERLKLPQWIGVGASLLAIVLIVA